MNLQENEKASIYLCVEVPFNNRVKIGFTTQTGIRRLQAIQVGNPVDLRMEYITDPIPFYREYEDNLKIALEDTKLRGELFGMEEWELEDLKMNLQEDEEILVWQPNDFNLEGVKQYRENK